MGAERVDVANRGASVNQPEPSKPLPPFWGYEESTPLDLFSLPNMAPRPGDPDWRDPIDPLDLGPLSDEPANDGGRDVGFR